DAAGARTGTLLRRRGRPDVDGDPGGGASQRHPRRGSADGEAGRGRQRLSLLPRHGRPRPQGRGRGREAAGEGHRRARRREPGVARVAALRLRDLALFLPRLGRMLASLMADRSVPRTAKIALAAVAVYLASPIDITPDSLPLLGYLDDALLCSGARAVLLKYWPAASASLDAVAAVARRVARWVPSKLKARIFSGTPSSGGPPRPPAGPRRARSRA